MESKSLTQEIVRGSSDIIVKSLEGMAADHFKALSVRSYCGPFPILVSAAMTLRRCPRCRHHQNSESS